MILVYASARVFCFETCSFVVEFEICSLLQSNNGRYCVPMIIEVCILLKHLFVRIHISVNFAVDGNVLSPVFLSYT